jgi:AmmeMemoRadiSam system protein A
VFQVDSARKFVVIIHHACLVAVFLSWAIIFEILACDSGICGEKGSKNTDRVKSSQTYQKSGGEEKDMPGKGSLTEEEGRYLLEIARNTINKKLSGEKDKTAIDKERFPVFSEKRGTFVTLTIAGNLRGCIGHIIPQEELAEGVQVNSINAAFRDPRFRPLTKEEWKEVKIEISILTDPEPLHFLDAEDLLNKLQPGIDGVIIKRGYHQATFLPQVWDQLPSKEDFLTHLCLKAGMEGDAWREGDLEVQTYQVQAFEE